MFELINNNNYFCPNCILFLTATTMTSLLPRTKIRILYMNQIELRQIQISIYTMPKTHPDQTGQPQNMELRDHEDIYSQ